MLKPDVLVVNIVSSFTISDISFQNSCFIERFSTIVSITKSADLKQSFSLVKLILPINLSEVSFEISPSATKVS